MSLLVCAFSNLKPVDRVFGMAIHTGRGFSGPGYNFAFGPASEKAVQQIIAELLIKEKWSDKFSERYLNERLNEMLIRAYVQKTSKHLTEECERLVEDYKNLATEQTVYLPIQGIQLGLPQVKLGGVTLRQFSSSALLEALTEPARARFFTACAGNPFATEQSIVAELRVVAEPMRAIERGIEEVRRVFDILCLAIPSVHPWNKEAQIGFEGQSLEWVFTALVVGDKKDSFDLLDQNIGYADLKLDAATIQRLEQIGILKLSDLLEKANPNEFEEALLRSVHWFAMAHAATEPENRLLNLVTSLEVLFTPKGRDPISNAVAEGVAFVSASTLKSRKTLKKRIKEFYSRRSSLSHHGTGLIISSELNDLRDCVGNVVLWMVEKLSEFKSRDDLLSWIEDEKLR